MIDYARTEAMRFSIGAAALATLTFILSTAAAMPAMSQSPTQTLRSWVGTWNCTNSGGGMASTTERAVYSMYGRWLKIDAKVSGYAVTEFIGYDAISHRWINMIVGESGGYSLQYSNSTNIDGSTWHSGYPAQNGSGTFRIASPNRHTFDGTFQGSHGKTVTTHAVCTRAS
jgi:hypothetical protein